MLRLHQYLIGLRRRHPWLHTATTSRWQLTNTQYVYRTGADAGSLLVALNVDDAPLPLSLPDLGVPSGRVIAGAGAPPRAGHLADRSRPARLVDRRTALNDQPSMSRVTGSGIPP